MIDPTHNPEWAEALVATQVQFTRELEARGFQAADRPDVWEGELEVVDLSGGITTTGIDIEIPDEFPFEPPKVTDAGMVSAHTWHHNRDWSLCLYGRRGVGDRPWQTVDRLLDRVQDWFRNAAEGWPDDPPDLDMERYFERAADFVTYNNIDELVGKPVMAKRMGARWHVERTGFLPPKARRRGGRLSGWAGDLGDLDSPVHDWPTVHAALGSSAKKVEAGVRDRSFQFLLLRYHRGEHEGVVVLFASLVDGDIRLAAGTAANDDKATRSLRAGAPEVVNALGGCSLAIIGVGAIGSFVAELMGRHGIGELHLVDPDRLRPGNVVRHFAGYEGVGEHKTIAVRDLLDSRELISKENVTTSESRLDAVSASEVIRRYDAVVDATADDNVRGLLVQLREDLASLGTPSNVVSVAVHRMGGVIRCDRWPRSTSGPAPIPEHPDGERDLREGGCADPVSVTPAGSVVAAASLASRHVVDSLLGTNILPDSVVEILLPQPDEPYQNLNVIND